MTKATYFVLAILLIGVVSWFALTRVGIEQAQAKSSPAGEPYLGGIRIVVRGENPEETIDVLIAAAKDAGWSKAKVDSPNKITFAPPEHYTPEMFGRLLEALEKTEKRNFGLQLLDADGRAIGPDGRPID